MLNILIFLLIIAIIIYIIFKYFFSLKIPLQTINFYTGGLGSGKTLYSVKTAIKCYNRRKLFRFIFTLIYFVHYPFNAKKRRDKLDKKLPCPRIISNFPILINKKKRLWSEPLKKNHLIGYEALPQGSIIVLDEAGYMFPNEKLKRDIIKKYGNYDLQLNYNITFLRHFINPIVIFSTQSIGEVDITIRRKVNRVYLFSNFKKILFFFFKFDVHSLLYAEDLITNTNEVNNMGQLYVFGFFGRKRYESRYMFHNYLKNIEKIDMDLNTWQDFFVYVHEIEKPAK